MECEYCRREFEIPYNKHKKWRFCSLECCYAWRRENSIGWKINREKALKKANYKCEKCGKMETLQVHHKEKAIYLKGHSPSKETNNNLDNLIVLCNSCHKKEHSKGIKRFIGKGICLACGKKFRFYPKSNRGKYCSRKCAYKSDTSIKIKKKCVFCGNNFLGKKKAKFCSIKCKSRDFYKKYGRKK